MARFLVVCVTALTSLGLLTGGAAAAAAAGGPAAQRLPASGIQLPSLVSQSPLSYTPNVYAGNTCGNACSPSTVYGTVVVNGEVVVAGAFTQACTPAPVSFAQCPNTVPVSYIFAYDPTTGAIDPNFMPVLDQGPVLALAAGPDNTVYVGGKFTTVNGTSSPGIAQLSVTPGQPADGQLVPGFAGQATGGAVRALAFNGGALYAGGAFGQVDGVKTKGIARLDATTGALDPSFHIVLSQPNSGAALQVLTMSLTPDGHTLAIGGSFLSVNGQSIPRVALIQTGGGVGATATLDNWSAPVLANACSAEHDYVNAIDFAPDGSFFVIDTTGYKSAGGASVCDAAARFETGATGTNIQPTWVNYSGGDSFHSVLVTGSVVYLGGHNRWVNNECGNNRVCEANSVLVMGLSAVDANTGLALPWWHPMTSRGVGVQSLTPYPAGAFPGSGGGLIIGTDVSSIGGAAHSELAMFPLASTSSQTPGGPIMSGMFSTGRIGGLDETNQGIPDMCVDDSTQPGNPVQLSTCLDNDEQNWTIEPDGTIQNNGLCLDTQNQGTTSGTPVVASPCSPGTTSQQWLPGTGNTLANQASGLCLDDPGASTTSGAQLDIATCDGSIQQSWPLPVAQAPPPPPPAGPVFSALVQSSTQPPCLTDKGGRAKPGAAVVLSTCLGQATQNWIAEADGTFRINGLCLDTSGGGTSVGTPVVLNTCNGGTSQVWTPGTPGTDNQLVQQASGLCLDDPGSNTANGTQLQIYSCSGGGNQQWWLPTV
ncbi:MAG TPA: ricin-type beta-trefoil lectin domain protein [Streptosporangiaceae bacterium]|nr:ricin-type beta-trefoil lectin domain protein [Streptosporangiaceae bacterium]